MRSPDSRPFSSVVAALFNDERVSIPLLFRLSDMQPEEIAEFQAQWPRQRGERRAVISRHLADISEDNFEVDFSPVFAICLADPLPEVRLAGLDGLWDSSNTAVVEPILNLMQNDADERVRAAAASTLGHFILMAEWGQLPARVSPPIVSALLAQLDDPQTAVAVRRAALESIAGASHPRVPELISRAYDSGDEWLQLSAVFAMGKSADERWIDIIMDEMGNSSWEMRLEAARAAGAIGSAEAISELAELTRDEELAVQLVAVNALGKIGGDLAAKILTSLAEDPDAEELYEAIDEALEEIDWLGGDLNLPALEWRDEE